MRNNPIFLILFILLAFVLFTHSADAVKQEPQYSLTGLTIVHSQADFIPLGSSATFGWHVYNSTNYWVDNSTTECKTHIVDSLGTHIDEKSYYGGSERGWYVNLTGSAIVNTPGIYGYIISCNNTEAGFFAGQLDIAQVSERQAELPVSVTLALLGVFLFSLFFASYFAVQKHPLVYLFTMMAFLFADILVWLNWRILTFNGSPIANVFYVMYLAMLLITFVMAIVTMLDITRMVINQYKKKEAAKNIARFGYA